MSERCTCAYDELLYRGVDFSCTFHHPPCERCVWFRENSSAQAALARCRELAAEWEAAAARGGSRNYAASLFATAASDLRAALGEESPQ